MITYDSMIPVIILFICVYDCICIMRGLVPARNPHLEGLSIATFDRGYLEGKDG